MTHTATTALATKYRPLVLEDYVGNKEAVEAIASIVETKKVPNALLLHGPTGTGKTTLARIFASLINGTKVPEIGDYEELNAANARGVEDMRELIARAGYAPLHRFRVIIIDEAHQLTPQAVEAFLKPLEEPPPRTVFVLCTTDPHRFPTKVINRCRVLAITAPEVKALAKHLFTVAKKEGVSLPKELAVKLAEANRDSVRAAMYALESVLTSLSNGRSMEEVSAEFNGEVAGEDELTLDLVYGLVNAGTNNATRKFITAVTSVDAASTKTILYKALWGVEFALASQAGRYATKVTFPSALNKRLLKEVMPSDTDALLVIHGYLTDVLQKTLLGVLPPHTVLISTYLALTNKRA